MAKKQQRKSGDPRKRAQTTQQTRTAPRVNSTTRTGRKQQEIQLERRKATSARTRLAQVFVSLLVAFVILGTVFSALSGINLISTAPTTTAPAPLVTQLAPPPPSVTIAPSTPAPSATASATPRATPKATSR